MVDDTIQHEPQAETASPRRVLTETEELRPCPNCGSSEPLLYEGAACHRCGDRGSYWQVTSRTVQVGHSFEEQAAYQIIKGLHEHIRKAAQSIEDAAKDFDKLGQTKQSAKCRAAAKAILKPVEGQD